MRLLQSRLVDLGTKKPQRTFLAHLLGRLLLLPGRATCRNLSRYSPYHEKTFARWYATEGDVVRLNKAAMTAVVPSDHEQALVMDASFVPKSGKQTSGLDRFWNSSQSRTEQGLAVSTLAWLDVTDTCAYCLDVAQTPPAPRAADRDTPRIDVYGDQLTRVVAQHALGPLRYVVTDGYSSKQKFLAGVRAFGLHQIGTLRLDANRRDLSTGPPRRGPGRPKTSDGTVNWADRSRFEPRGVGEEPLMLSHQVVHHVQCTCHLRVVLVVDIRTKRHAVLFSTDVALDALTLSRYDKARFQSALLFRDAKQFTGLTDCQARSHAQLAFHFNVSMTAVTLAKLAARQHDGNAAGPFSMASLKRRAFNQHLIDRIGEHLASRGTLEKSRPDYETLCNYGTLTDLAA